MAEYHTTDGWGASTWLLIGGGVVLLIILLAVFSGGGDGTPSVGTLAPEPGAETIETAPAPVPAPTPVPDTQ